MVGGRPDLRTLNGVRSTKKLCCPKYGGLFNTPKRGGNGIFLDLKRDCRILMVTSLGANAYLKNGQFQNNL